MLEELQAQHPLPSIILEHRKLHKLKSGFMDTLEDLASKGQRLQQGVSMTEGVFVLRLCLCLLVCCAVLCCVPLLALL